MQSIRDNASDPDIDAMVELFSGITLGLDYIVEYLSRLTTELSTNHSHDDKLVSYCAVGYQVMGATALLADGMVGYSDAYRIVANERLNDRFDSTDS